MTVAIGRIMDTKPGVFYLDPCSLTYLGSLTNNNYLLL